MEPEEHVDHQISVIYEEPSTKSITIKKVTVSIVETLQGDDVRHPLCDARKKDGQWVCERGSNGSETVFVAKIL